MKSYIVCCGTSGRCLIYGYAATEPKQGTPARLERARMILYWTKTGLLGLAARGPAEGSKLTSAVETTETSPVTEWIAVSDDAAKRIDTWPAQ